jgi:hypothetical protein
MAPVLMAAITLRAPAGDVSSLTELLPLHVPVPTFLTVIVTVVVWPSWSVVGVIVFVTAMSQYGGAPVIVN